ncbi:MAG TPA: cobalamin-binding protein [Planctomycetes bacterium]|nr:cobalamin-binding protein [Planctomycetota bacterium]
MIRDALGRELELARPPRRIVSLVPSLTALLDGLGLDEEVVGLTRFCVHPAGWKARKAVVGGTKDVRVEKVLALEPDLVLANWEENAREQVEALEAAGVAVYVTQVRDLAEDLAMVRALGELVGREARGEELARETERAFAALGGLEPLRALYLIWREPFMSVGGDTFVSAMLGEAGFVNVCGERERYPTLTPDELAALAPEVVLLSSEPYPFKEQHLAEVAALVPEAKVALADGELFSWYGSRILLAPDYFRRLRAGL